MTLNHWIKYILCTATLLVTIPAVAQTAACKDTAKHNKLRDAMWAACLQDDSHKLYAACWAYQAHCIECKDNAGYYDSWVCGVMYNLDRMNIHDAYHIANTMKDDLVRRRAEAKEEQFLAPKMLGHVYNACGNIPGALKEFEKAIELIKGTKYEQEGLSFLYLGMAHIQLNNNSEETLKWLEKDLEELARNKGQKDYWRGLADAYAMKSIVMFKQHKYDEFRKNIALAEQADAINANPQGDIFLPYARIYKTLLNDGKQKALAEVDDLPNLKERYLVSCDIYTYLGETEKAFLMQRELMHTRDSITGVIIAENIQNQEEEMFLLNQKQKAAHIMNIVLVIAMVLALMLIVGLALSIYGKRRYQEMLLNKNKELKRAYKQVAAADEMKTEFIRSVSHEIRTPLNIINGFTQVLMEPNAEFEPEERESLADTIGKNTRQITSLVNKMLAMANEHTKDLLKDVEETDALDICHKAMSAMPPVDPNRVRLELVDMAEGQSKTLTTNSDSLLQMLGNILENSAKFTDDGYIRLTLSKDKNYFHFTIQDTGCGIPSDKIDTIFNRFTKVDEFKEGLGLGLAYCHETVVKLGGTLVLDETSAAGTTFTLSLPIKLKTNNEL
jgi:signal transduction histidine kinase